MRMFSSKSCFGLIPRIIHSVNIAEVPVQQYCRGSCAAAQLMLSNVWGGHGGVAEVDVLRVCAVTRIQPLGYWGMTVMGMEGNLEHCDGGLARGTVPGYGPAMATFRIRVSIRARVSILALGDRVISVISVLVQLLNV